MENIDYNQILQWIGYFLAVSWAFFVVRILISVSQEGESSKGSALRKAIFGIFALAFISSFIGTIIFTIGIGAIFPKLTFVGAPLACPDGVVSVLSQSYSYKPGQQGVSHHIFCVSQTGEQKELTFTLIFYAGLIYSAILLTVWMWLGRFGLRIFKLGSSTGAVGKISQLKNLSAQLKSGANLDSTTVSQILSTVQNSIHDGTARLVNVDINQSQTSSIQDRLEKLEQLRDSGLIDTSTYEAKQAEILKEL